MKMTQKQTLFVKGDVVCFVFNSLNYEATMTRTHYSSYKIYNLKNVKLIDGGNQMERANIKSSFITNIKKIHDNHIDEQPEESEQPEEPITNIVDEQPEEPEQPTEEPITNIIDEQPEEPITNIVDEQPVTKAKRKDKKIVKEPEQLTEEPITNIIDEQPEEPITNIVDEQPVTKAKRKDKKIVKEPEQPKETIFKNCIMDNVKNLPLDLISNIIDYIPGITVSTINDDSGYYRYIKINDIRLKYYEKTKYGYKFIVIDSMHDLRKKYEYLHNVSEIWAGSPHFTMNINNVIPNIELNKIYFCNIILEKVTSTSSRYSHISTINSVEEEPDEQQVEQHVTKVKSKGKKIVKEPVAEPITNIIDEQPEEPKEEPINNILNESQKEEPINNILNESQNYDTTIDIAYKTKILSKYHVSALRVCYKNQIIKDCKNKLITFDEAKLKIKQIQDNEKKEDNTSYLFKIIKKFNSNYTNKKQLIINRMELQSEYHEMLHIVEQFKNDRITFEDANKMLEILRDRKKVEPNNCFMSDINNLPKDIIRNIIDYMPGPTSTILERDIIVNDIRLHYNTTKIYKNSIGKDKYYHMFNVIDSIPDLYDKNTFLAAVNPIQKRKNDSGYGYEISIENVEPNIELGKIYFCDIVFVHQPIMGRSFYRGTIHRAEESTLTPINYPRLDINNDLFTDV